MLEESVNNLYGPEYCYRIANLTVKMKSYGRTVEQAKPYLCEAVEKPDILITPLWPEKKNLYPNFTDDVGEYLFSGSSFYKQLLNYDGMMLHSSAVVVDGKAYLFTAPCGTGKSTHTNLWLELLGHRAYILNDDKPALRLEDGVWYAYGTPWSGKYDISVDARIPVGGIAAISRSETNTITPYFGKEAILDIMRQVNRPKDMAFRIKLMELLDKLFATVPIWKLECNKDIAAAELSYRVMSGVKENKNED